jgi:hypothetical protein
VQRRVGDARRAALDVAEHVHCVQDEAVPVGRGAAGVELRLERAAAVERLAQPPGVLAAERRPRRLLGAAARGDRLGARLPRGAQRGGARPRRVPRQGERRHVRRRRPHAPPAARGQRVEGAVVHGAIALRRLLEEARALGAEVEHRVVVGVDRRPPVEQRGERGAVGQAERVERGASSGTVRARSARSAGAPSTPQSGRRSAVSVDATTNRSDCETM